MTALLVALGGAAGALLRWAVDRLLNPHPGAGMPWGTLAVNVIGSCALGLVLGMVPAGAAGALLGTGLCGALTTYSTFGLEVVLLAEERRFGLAAGYALGSLLLGLLAFTAGAALIR